MARGATKTKPKPATLFTKDSSSTSPNTLCLMCGHLDDDSSCSDIAVDMGAINVPRLAQTLSTRQAKELLTLLLDRGDIGSTLECVIEMQKPHASVVDDRSEITLSQCFDDFQFSAMKPNTSGMAPSLERSSPSGDIDDGDDYDDSDNDDSNSDEEEDISEDQTRNGEKDEDVRSEFCVSPNEWISLWVSSEAANQFHDYLVDTLKGVERALEDLDSDINFAMYDFLADKVDKAEEHLEVFRKIQLQHKFTKLGVSVSTIEMVSKIEIDRMWSVFQDWSALQEKSSEIRRETKTVPFQTAQFSTGENHSLHSCATSHSRKRPRTENPDPTQDQPTRWSNESP